MDPSIWGINFLPEDKLNENSLYSTSLNNKNARYNRAFPFLTYP
ncbi:hypothetical protein JGUZn3_14010 [Entomobacter blattae]|uniref:Uncharacterized protein n=1 Tax=Entomobacter blattae TaxID=2762277 RepID=A0A7H1NS66_9PROT|nr:hypothetical protein JGUZn3_14010 [Entomobacter blattae]